VAVGRSRRRLESARELFEEYADSLPIDLSFQSFSTELRTLPGAYAPPRGGLWIALESASAVGCVAVRPHGRGTAELKRLYVRPACQGRGLGRRLTETAVRFARRAGYRRMRLDTLSSMAAAQALYASMGFRRIPAYRFNPVAGASFWELDLADARPRRPGAAAGAVG